jgi:hypothetical protein
MVFPSVDQGAAGKGEEGEEERGGGEGNGETEDDLDQAPQAATHVAEGEAQPGDDDDHHGDYLGDGALDRLEDALQGGLPRHAGTGGMGGATGDQSRN